MKESTERVISLMKEMCSAMKNSSLAKAEANFVQQVSQKQLEECLTDLDMDADDIVSVKEMLVYFYNSELEVN